MTQRSSRPLLLALGILVAAALSGACSMRPVHVDALPVRYPSAPQPGQVEARLVVVLDPQLVPETMRTTDPQTKKIDIYGVHSFVRRDVRNALADFFRDVQVVAPGHAPPPGGYVAEVRVQRIDTSAETATAIGTTGNVAYSHRAYGLIDWSIVIRDADTAEVLYSFSDRAIGTYALTSVHETGATIASAIEVAMLRFTKDLRDRGITATLRAHADAGAPAAPPAAEPAGHDGN